MSGHYFYAARCGDGTLYAGYTTDLARREAAHNAGRGAKYTRGRRPVRIIYSERFEEKGDALRMEHAFKRWPRQRKWEYIQKRRG